MIVGPIPTPLAAPAAVVDDDEHGALGTLEEDAGAWAGERVEDLAAGVMQHGQDAVAPSEHSIGDLSG